MKIGISIDRSIFMIDR